MPGNFNLKQYFIRFVWCIKGLPTSLVAGKSMLTILNLAAKLFSKLAPPPIYVSNIFLVVVVQVLKVSSSHSSVSLVDILIVVVIQLAITWLNLMPSL